MYFLWLSTTLFLFGFTVQPMALVALEQPAPATVIKPSFRPPRAGDGCITALSQPLMQGVSLWMASVIGYSSTSNANSNSINNGSDADFVNDTVVRVLDANAVKLQRSGIVSLAAVKTVTPTAPTAAVATAGSAADAVNWSPCLTFAPESKLAQLLPTRCSVRVKLVGSSSNGNNNRVVSQAVIVRSDSGTVVNEQLLQSGYGKLRSKNLAPDLLPNNTLQALLDDAKKRHKGIYQLCGENDNNSFVAEFEPIALTTEIRYGIDGGKPVLVRRSRDDGEKRPGNPGDVVGCSDFATYEDALRYYERYLPYYGDVARLDRDNDGVPCPKLPHTANPDRYRMKKGNTRQAVSY